MTRLVSNIFVLLLAICAPHSLNAMAQVGQDQAEMAPFNEVVERQNTAFKAGEFDAALALNGQLLELAPDFAAERPELMGMILYDRAVIQMRKGNTSGALTILDKAYANGDLQAIDKAYFPMDYYGTVMTAYIHALRDSGRADWRTVQSNFVNDLFSGETAQTIHFSTWTNIAMVDLKEAGHISEALQLCNRQKVWFETNPQAAKATGFQGIGWPTVSTGDYQQPAFITGLALRTGRYESFYAFLRADLEDSCAGIQETAGDLGSALTHRKASGHWIEMQDDSSFLGLVQLRLARLFAFQGNDIAAGEILHHAMIRYRYNRSDKDVASAVCPELEFVVNGKKISADEVLQKFRSSENGRISLGGLDCKSVEPT